MCAEVLINLYWAVRGSYLELIEAQKSGDRVNFQFCDRTPKTWCATRGRVVMARFSMLHALIWPCISRIQATEKQTCVSSIVKPSNWMSSLNCRLTSGDSAQLEAGFPVGET